VRYPQIKVFSILFGIVYTTCFYFNWALIRYYPIPAQWYRTSQPASEAGPAILWYAWLAQAFVISAVIAALVPRKLAARITANAVWAIPALLILAIIVYERRWFY
jgi:hypothetical protein